jgi:hypothetical protein
MTSDDELEDALDQEDGDAPDADGRSSGALGFVGGLLLGTLVGAGIALLVAPERGRILRRRLKRRLRNVRQAARRGARRFRHDVEREAARRRRWLERAVEREGA